MHVFETPGDVSLHVRLPSGSVVVTTADTPQTTVEILARGRRGQDAVDEIDVTLEERRGGHVVKIEQKDHFASEMDYFAQCVRDGKEVRTPGEEGLADMRVIEACYKAARSGRAEKV